MTLIWKGKCFSDVLEKYGHLNLKCNCFNDHSENYGVFVTSFSFKADASYLCMLFLAWSFFKNKFKSLQPAKYRRASLIIRK
jgi:hypothetical protein